MVTNREVEMEPFLAGLKEVAATSAQLTSLALAMLGGSIAVVIGSSHFSPRNRWARGFYFILAFAWLFLLISIRAGKELARSYLATLFTKGDAQKLAFDQINTHYDTQLNYLLWGVIACSIWLVAYLIWWVIFRQEGKS